MKHISIDIETYSSTNLSKAGVYRYADSDDFEILLFGYAVDTGKVQVIDLACGEKIPTSIIEALSDDAVTKWAFNAQFERVCLSHYVKHWLAPGSWHCTMVWSATLGLPLSLEGVGTVLGLDKQKLKEGHDLIKYFCMPCAPTKANEGRTRNLPQHDREKWQRFTFYNQRDVETEMSIQKRLSIFPVSATEWQYYKLDQEINDRGIQIDATLVRQAIVCDDTFRHTHLKIAQELTGLENPNSPIQLKEWLAANGMPIPSLFKSEVATALETATGTVKAVLELRQQLAKSSVKKYTAMETAKCHDGRIHGLLQFYGANRTGRWSGRLVQVQNLPQNHLPDLALARSLIRSGQFDMVELLYDSVPSVLSELIRTACIPKPGYRFFVADFSAIEARVIAWLAKESWRMKVFAVGGDIYCASASQMFHVPVVKHGINGHLRQKGKIAELALGYGGSVGALKAMGAIEMGIPEEELQPLVTAWRTTNPRIVKLWWDIDRATKKCVKEHVSTETHGIHFKYQSGCLFLQLPSGRRLSYVKPRMALNRFGKEAVTYEGIGSTKKWERLESYGAKFVENIVQATSRDILAEAMERLNGSGFNIVMHVHDEVIIEAPCNASLTTICTIMGQPPNWADSLLLHADGYVCDFYQKD
ncbi:DNA polymerase [uncultured Dialister sp.]|uniref:DNA polymerase n=1 Tax=uncultured Dialister sp. TaxID=278064 RepID=UPI00265D907A|nr:DNA polymerase [uncultured Dialister sp.]